MKGDIYVMESKMNEFIKITEGEKVALIDPVGKVCLGVSKRFADNLDKPEFQEKLFPVWEQQTEFVKEIEKNHEKINIVAAGLAKKCEIQLSYAIGVAHPTSIMVDTFGTGKISDESLVDMIRKEFDLRPAGIIQTLNLRRPIYKQTAAYGHFGRNDLNLPWERLDKVEELKKYLK